MRLAIIILSYNVRYLLEQCIESLIASVKDINNEIIVVDNGSTDESAHMVKSKYPTVRLISLNENLGFAKANNIAVHQTQADFILILNPDTIVNASAIKNSLDYISTHGDVGMIGVQMIDHRGKFLKESKRGFPDFWTSVTKFLGLYRIAPKSKVFNHYYLGHLSQEGIHEVEALTGAFMMMPRKLFIDCGGFDEKYFMYGEDIDLSKTFRDNGKKLIYLGSEVISHLKGRSATYDSYQHVKNFYQAMAVFVNKNYTNGLSKYVVQIAILMAGIFSYLKRNMITRIVPIIDIALMAITIWGVQYFWARYWFKIPEYFQHNIFFINAFSYIFIWWTCQRFFKTFNACNVKNTMLIWKAVWTGTFVILALYALMPEHWRSSRAVIILSSVVLSILLPILRSIFATAYKGMRVLFVGNEEQEAKYNPFFRRLQSQQSISFISRIDSLHEFFHRISENNYTHVLIDRDNTSIEDILFIHQNKKYERNVLEITHAQELVGGQLQLSMARHRYTRTIFNFIVSIFLIPLLWWRKDIRPQLVDLILQRKYWTGYKKPMSEHLPLKKEGIWVSQDMNSLDQPAAIYNFNYAKNYSLFQELKIIFDNLI